MRRKMYQLRDKVAACLVGPILLERNDAPAVRSFYLGCEDPQSNLSRYPLDYELVTLGEYDDEVGITEISMAVVATGADFLKEKERKNGVPA